MTTNAMPEAAKPNWALKGLIDNFPYVAIIVLGLVGISWTSLSESPSATYWLVVTPINAIVCIVAGWRHTPSGGRVGMIVTQILQWASILIGMYLLTISDVQRSLTSSAYGLMILTLLGLGVFISGLNLRAWKLCVTGAFLAVSVPAIAWLHDAALLLFFIGLALIALLLAYWWLRDRFSAGA